MKNQYGEKVLFFEDGKIEINLLLEIWNRDLQEKDKYERRCINSREGGGCNHIGLSNLVDSSSEGSLN